MKQSYKFKSEFFLVFITDNNGDVTRDTFSARESAELFSNEVLCKRDDIKQIDILELLSSIIINNQQK